jgi:hypothetical protein
MKLLLLLSNAAMPGFYPSTSNNVVGRLHSGQSLTEVADNSTFTRAQFHDFGRDLIKLDQLKIAI